MTGLTICTVIIADMTVNCTMTDMAVILAKTAIANITDGASVGQQPIRWQKRLLAWPIDSARIFSR